MAGVERFTMRPKAVWRVVLPIVTAAVPASGVGDGAWSTAFGTTVLAVLAVMAYRDLVEVQGPVVRRRAAWGEWRELRLDQLARLQVRWDYSGRNFYRKLTLVDADDQPMEFTLRWWDGWRDLVAAASRHAPHDVEVDDRTRRKLRTLGVRARWQ